MVGMIREGMSPVTRFLVCDILLIFWFVERRECHDMQLQREVSRVCG